MTALNPIAAGSSAARSARGRSRGGSLELRAGVAILIVIILASLFVTIVPLHSVAGISDNTFAGPSGRNWLGTDNIGRDSFTRLAVAVRTSLLISAAATVVAGIIGTFLGLVAGYLGRAVDNVVMRICDVLMAIPAILVALIVRVIVGPGILPLIAAMGIIYAPTFARVVRAPVLALRERDFVVAAEISGVRPARIMFSHLLPNVMTPLSVQAAATASEVVLLEAGLSYLGQGVQPPAPSAGRMISEFQKFMVTDPLLILLPAIGIVAISVSWNLIADGLQSRAQLRRSGSSGPAARGSFFGRMVRPAVGVFAGGRAQAALPVPASGNEPASSSASEPSSPEPPSSTGEES